MRNVKWVAVLSLGLGLCVGLSSVHAAGKSKGTKLRAKGTVESIERGMIEAKLDDVGKVSIPITEKVDIHARGDFGLAQLKPGMYLSFSGVLKGSEVEGEVMEASMFTLADGFKPGVVKITDDGPQSILGKVENVDGQTVTLNAGRKVSAKFTKKIKITLDTTDYSVAGPGNKIEVKGTLYEKEKEVKANSVVILVGPLGGGTATKKVTK